MFHYYSDLFYYYSTIFLSKEGEGNSKREINREGERERNNKRERQIEMGRGGGIVRERDRE